MFHWVSPLSSRISSWLFWSPTIVFFASSFYSPKQISGYSMRPTLNPEQSPTRDIGIFDCASVRLSHKLKRDDIVAFRAPQDRNRVLVKRVVGTEGDVVQTLPPCPYPVVRVPEGHVWVEGDESFFSDDSNVFGPIPVALVESKLIGILWPPNRFGSVLESGILPMISSPAYQDQIIAFKKYMARKARVNTLAATVLNDWNLRSSST